MEILFTAFDVLNKITKEKIGFSFAISNVCKENKITSIAGVPYNYEILAGIITSSFEASLTFPTSSIAQTDKT